MSPSSIVLSGRYDLSTLPALKTELLEAAAAGEGPVRVDLTAVESGDVGFAQLLLAFEASLRAEGRSLAVSASDAVADLFRRLGAALPGAPA